MVGVCEAMERNPPDRRRRKYKKYKSNSYSTPFPQYEFQIDIVDMISIMEDIGTDVDDQPPPAGWRDGGTVHNAFMECLKF